MEESEPEEDDDVVIRKVGRSKKGVSNRLRQVNICRN